MPYRRGHLGVALEVPAVVRGEHQAHFVARLIRGVELPLVVRLRRPHAVLDGGCDVLMIPTLGAGVRGLGFGV